MGKPFLCFVSIMNKIGVSKSCSQALPHMCEMKFHIASDRRLGGGLETRLSFFIVYICIIICCLLLSYQALSVQVWSHIPKLG